jgi:plastocyanin
MRRAATAIASALLVAALALGPGGAWPSNDSRAAAADCAWNRHAKRVVKHVRHDGQLRRVVRVRHFWRCDALPVAPVAATTPTPLPAPGPGPPAPEPEANRVGVSAHDQGGDLGFALTRPEVKAGRVTVELNNQGEDPHNLNLEREGGGEPVYALPNALPSQQQVASFELPAGTYRLWCSLPEHEGKGMHSTLVVE